MRKCLLFAVAILVSATGIGQVIFTQNFDAAWTIPSSLSPAWSGTATPPDNQWQRDDYTTGWTTATGSYTPAGANSTLHSARFHSYDAASGTTGDFISPTINLGAYSAGAVKLDFYHINTSGSDVLNVYSSNDNGATWSSALTASIGIDAVWVKYTVTLPGNSAITKIKFTATSDWGTTDIGLDEVSVYNPVAGNAPPINFTASAVTQSSMTIGWTDNSTNETSFRVYRSTDNVTFAQVGTDIPSTSTATTGTLYSQSQTGLSAGVTYYYRIASVVTMESGYLLGNQVTLPPVPICGTKTVGPTGNYLSLTAAFTDLAANGVSCAVNLVLQSTYVSTVETFPIAINPIAGTSATQKVIVYPSAAGLSVTSNNASGTINNNGASWVTFDGRVNATGSTNSLTVENSSTTGYACQLVNGASNNAIQYCIVKGSSSSGLNGIITFAGTTGLTGNSNNLINYCEVAASASGSPLYAIYSSGSANPAAYNASNTLSNCNIHDFYAPAGGNPIGVGMFAGSTAWTISGNSIYMVNTQSPTVANGYNVIFISSGDGYNILNNYIGGSAPLCGGTPWTLNGNGTPPTIANFIYAIRFQTGALTVNPSTLQGNTISNILLYTNPTAASIFFTGLLSVVGVQNISNNVIGSGTGTGSITISVGNGAYASTYEGFDFRGMYGNVMNNTVGSITITGAAASTSTNALTLRPISVTPTVQNGTDIVSGNLVGSLTTPNSIQTPAMTYPPVQIQGFFVSPSGAGTMSVANNNVANISNLSSYSTSHIVGIYAAGTGLPNVLSGNTVRDLTTTSTSTTIAGIASVVGIYSLNSVPGSIIRSNSIYNLTNTSATAAVGVHGIYTGHIAGNLVIEKNFIHNLGLSTSSTTSQVTGMYLANGGAYATAKNNMIQLGVNPDGSANTSSCVINGIYESTATVDSVLNNSVYIGGSPAAGATGSTYAFNSVLTPSLSTPRVCLDNIFYNARSGGSTGKHYGIKIAGTTILPLGVTSNYNLIIANGATGGTFGSFNAVDLATFAAYKGATGTEMASGNADPNFVTPNGTFATADLHVASPTPIEAAGKALSSVPDDFDGAARSGLTPPDVGADAGNFTLSADMFGPNITYVPVGNGTTANRLLTNWATITDNVGVSGGASLPRIYYKKSTDADAFVGNTSADNGWKYTIATNAASPYSFTINYSIINGGSVAAGNTIQYFVVAQDAANNLSSNYLMAGYSATPPVQNINAAPAVATVQSYTIVANTIPTSITVPGTYATLTGTGGAFDMINQGVLAGNTTINITADLTEPGTVALNPWAEDVPGANYTLTVKPDAASLRTISGTAVASGVAMIRTNGASRFTIDGQAGKLLTFRNTNATAGNTGPTIQFNGGSQSCFLKNSTIENNGTTTTYGTVSVGATGTNIVEISGNDIRDAIAGTAGLQTTGIYNASFTNSLRVLNNNIYNFKNYGLYFTTVADGAVITGNSFYYNSVTASTAAQYCVYLVGGTNNHTLSNNYFGGQAPLCAGAAWTNTSTNATYAAYLVLGVITPSTISNNTFKNFNNTSTASLYGFYFSGGVANILNNMIGSTTVPGSITGGGNAGYFYGIYGSLSATAPSSVQGNTVTGVNYTNASFTGALYLMGLTGGWLRVGTVTPNILGSNTVSGAITITGAGSIYGLYCSSTNPGNAIENNIIGNWSLNATTGSPYARGMYIYSANVKKNKIFNISCLNPGVTPYIYGIHNYGASGVTNEYSNNLISLDGGAATNPVIYGFYDASYSTSFYNLYYNDIYITGPATTTSNTYAYYRSVAAFYTLNDNIFANNRVAGGTGKHYAAFISSIGNLSSNYNDLYSVAGPLGYYNAADQATIALWRTATSGDANSQNVDPQFVSTTDLHTSVLALNNTGVFIPAVTTDYAGAIRTNPPDIGAYQFSLSSEVVTVAASGITGATATLNGTINSNNESAVSGFDWGLTVAYGTSVAGVPATVVSTTPTPISAALSGLSSNTLYHFRAKGTVGASPYYGSDLAFTSATQPPLVVTLAATGVGSYTATLNGTVNANNASTTVSFDYGLTVAYGSSVAGIPSPVTGTSAVPVSVSLTGLLPGNTYHFRVNGINGGGTTNGIDLTFATPANVPTVVTNPATGISISGATLNGTVTANGLTTTTFFDYGLTAAYGTTVAGVPATVTGNTATAVSAVISGLVFNTTYHFRARAVNSLGTTNGADVTFITTCTSAGPAGPISGPAQACQGGTGYVYTCAPIVNATGYNWTVPVGGVITAGANTNTITVSYGATAVPGYVIVYGLGLCGNGSPSQYLVTVNAAPVPVITGPATACTGDCGKVYTTQAGMTSYVWTLSAGGTITAGTGTNSITVCWNTSGAKTVSVNYNNAAGCPAVTATVYNVTVNTLPTPTIAGNATVCQSTTTTYTTQTGQSAYVWGVSAGGQITGGQGTSSVSILWNAAGAQTVSVNYANASGCTAAAPVSYAVTANAAPVPTITGSNNLCANTGFYDYTTETGKTGYVWTVSSGGTITAGQGTAVLQVTWNTPGAQIVTVNYNNAFSCSAPAPTVFNVTVNGIPGSAGTISGASMVCFGTTGSYSVPVITNATSYIWSLPAGASIASGAGTNSITVNFAPNAVSGNITVCGNSICGNGTSSAPFAVTIMQLPLAAGTVTGLSSVCAGEMGVAYSVPPVTNASAYTWNLPAGASIASGANTPDITVDFANGATSGDISVFGTNICGIGAASPNFAVTVNPLPATPVISAIGDTLFSNAPLGNQWYFEGGAIPAGTSQTLVAAYTGWYWDVVTVNGCSSDTSNHIHIIATGTNDLKASSFVVYPVPNNGMFKLVMNSLVTGSFDISICNNIGAAIYTKQNVELKGSQEMMIDLRPIPAGIYTMIIRNGESKVVRKIIVN